MPRRRPVALSRRDFERIEEQGGKDVALADQEGARMWWSAVHERQLARALVYTETSAVECPPS
jgi:hypothetical protein